MRNKLDRIRKIRGLWSADTSWNLAAVDEYLSGLNLPSLEELVLVSDEELAMIPEVD